MSIIVGTDGVTRCAWAGVEPQMVAYHDTEWGRVTRDEQHLFEKICLEGFQAGLSWQVVLNKRDRFRAMYHAFDPEKIAAFSYDDVTLRAGDAQMIRQRAKHEAVVTNARAYLRMRDSGVSLYEIVYASHDPTRPRPTCAAEIPAATDASRALAKRLKQAGFVFVGPVTMYALMQAVGVVNDHLGDCATSV